MNEAKFYILFQNIFVFTRHCCHYMMSDKSDATLSRLITRRGDELFPELVYQNMVFTRFNNIFVRDVKRVFFPPAHI